MNASQPRLYQSLAADYFLLERRGQVLDRDIALLSKILPLREGARVLDLGCGSGEQAAALLRNGVRLIGVDSSEAMLECARRRNPGPEYILGDIGSDDFWKSAPMTAQSFQGALSLFGVWNYLSADSQQPARALRSLAGVLEARAPAVLEVWLRGPYERLRSAETGWRAVTLQSGEAQRRRQLRYHEAAGYAWLELIHEYRPAAGGAIESDRHWMRLFDIEGFRGICEEAGFSVVQTMQDSSGAPVNDLSGGAWFFLRRS